MNIFQYIQGDRIGKEANHTEYEAMKEPFLADALDGYTGTKGNHKRQIEKLQNSIAQKCKKKTNYGLIGSIVAVTAVVLGVAVYFLIIEPDAAKNLFAATTPKNPVKENIQKKIEQPIENTKEETPIVEPEVKIETKKEEKPVEVPATVTTPPVSINTNTPIEVSEKKEDLPTQIVKETPATPAIVSADPPIEVSTQVVEQPEPTEEVTQAPPPAVKEESDKPKIKGRVTDKSGSPLAGASVSVPGANIRTTTNANGYFELEAENNSNIMVRSLGYDPVIQTGNTSQNMQVIMEEVPKQ